MTNKKLKTTFWGQKTLWNSMGIDLSKSDGGWLYRLDYSWKRQSGPTTERHIVPSDLTPAALRSALVCFPLSVQSLTTGMFRDETWSQLWSLLFLSCACLFLCMLWVVSNMCELTLTWTVSCLLVVEICSYQLDNDNFNYKEKIIKLKTIFCLFQKSKH